MIVLVLIFILSLVPSVLIYLWLKNLRKDDADYTASCKKALLYGFLAALPVTLISMLLDVLGNLAGIKNTGVILQAVYHNYIVLALTEELVKYLLFKQLLKKCSYRYSWLDAVVFMIIIGIGFEILEAIPYAFGSGPGQMLARGLTIMHGGFGFIMGWFCGKALYTGDKKYEAAGFLIPFLFHGTYDFSLAEPLSAVSDLFIFLPLLLAAASLVILVVMIRFIRKARNQEMYTGPLPQTGQEIKN